MKMTLFVCLLFSLFSCMSNNKETKFDQLWMSIKTASTADKERLAVDNMRQFLQDEEGSYAIFAVDRAAQLHDIQSQTIDYKISDINEYELHVQWNKEESIGKGWKPKDVQHVYDFFLE